MKAKILFFVMTLVLILPLSAQTVIWMEDFEDHGNTENGGAGRYTSTNDFHDGINDDDYFGRIEGLTEEFFLTNSSSGIIANSVVAYVGWNGNFYYAAEDVNDVGGTIGSPDGVDFKDVSFSGIDISNGSGLNFYGLFATGENDPCGLSVYDDLDFVEVYYEVDGGGEVLALCFNPDIECNIPGDVTNEPLHNDPDCDGDGGEGTLLTSTFAEFTFGIPDGTALNLRIRVRMDAGSEEFAFDYFRVEADNLLNISTDVLEDNITLHPNPTSGSVTLNKSNGLQLSQLEMYSILGNKVYSINLENMGSSLFLDFDALTSGIYLVKINAIDGQSFTKKLIIE